MNLYMRTKNLGPCADEDFEKTVMRAKKYIGRLNYLHFSQFTQPLESMTMEDYEAIMGDEAKKR